MKTLDLKTYFNEIGHSEYQRENFDTFLKKIGFNYAVPTIHIAGSNGKGSTANYLANIYREHGLKVGLFTSPYLIRVNEMINIDGQDISDEDFIKALKENDKLFKKYSLSPFEIQTYIALAYFQKNKCDIAIVECGMGGEIDATNIFIPVVSVITSISLEHTVYLGRSLCEIAYQKAGIIKEEIPVITGILEDEAINTIVEVAKDKKSQVLVSVEPTNVVYENRGFNFSYLTYKNLRINSSAYYSLKDACIALEVIIKLMDYFRVNEEEIRAGLARTFMPVRMEIIQENPLIVVDGSHNPEGILNMTKSLNDIAENRPVHILFACFKDKNVERMLAYLGEYSTDITLTTFPHNRARKKEDYFLFLDDFNFEENALICLDELKEKYPEDFILITGSLAFASYVKEKIKRG
ncbi:MAG TPA: bifunctional folylpolyglutamate synthase/dihydrofolate synthase [Erysipelotrichaceae bacterium]|nr:bifunctional folylpolyglutamate synthase/dihydrofolate synthase [Erysipelotrichaceae bacterium]